MTGTAAEYLIWISEDRRYGLNIGHCQEVVNGVQITPIPKAPPYICGLVNLRGTVVVVFDLDVLLGYRSTAALPEASGIVRIRTEGYPMAMIADKIIDATAIPGENIETSPANLSESERNFVTHVAKTGDGLVLIPNVKAIIENFLINKGNSNA